MDLTIYNKDSSCMDEIQTGTIDLIITSPPYWNLKNYEHPEQLGFNVSYKQYLYQLKKHFHECMRVLKEDSFICINVGDIRSGKYKETGRPRLYSIQSDIISFFTVEMDFDLFQHFIWEKFGVKKGEKSKLIYGSVGKGEYKDFGVPPFLYNDLLTEHILVFRKPGNRKREINYEQQAEAQNLIPKEILKDWLHPIWKINPSRHNLHKATFPDEIAMRLIRLFSLKNDIVLDPFAGTGTTLRNATEQGRNAIGYELNTNYIKDIIDSNKLIFDGNKYSSSI
ncbi:site-specific DNA-methyltransferase [Bacillus sp. ISL-35]|uniref:DNA-methyltransferase n=1 Tax=Bacillus sp. ISL-35 TaxID=2819122 RepID=UPI001BE667BD|nr:site-specific DNA-methyltransferase [Bacillus sp. ISL-35]MBT2677368.1 site-specific DNA-methyltransferase [Bacillus sp. ISL-35]MBT2702245.1 site-specific DNA-methyltransferase [Chryseobacterium sp. ISL-80]